MKQDTFTKLYSALMSSLSTEELKFRFERTFSYLLWKEGSLLTYKLPTPDVYVTSLLKSLEQTGITIDPLAKVLINMLLVDGVKPKAPKPSKPRLTVAPTVTSGSSVKVPKVGSTNGKAATTSVLPVPITVSIAKTAKIRQLSSQSEEKVKAELTRYRAQNTRLYKMCDKDKCTLCIELFENVALTKCTHPKPCNESGLFPHLSRTGFRGFHNDRLPMHAFHCASRHWKNPFHALSSSAGSSDQLTTTVPIVRISTSHEFPNKRKLSDISGVIQQNISASSQSPTCPCGAECRRNAKRKWICSVSPLCPKWLAEKEKSA